MPRGDREMRVVRLRLVRKQVDLAPRSLQCSSAHFVIQRMTGPASRYR